MIKKEKFLDIWTDKKIGGGGKLTRAKIDDYTAVRLRETIEYAVANSSFYREKFEEQYYRAKERSGVSFIENFRSLPFTTPHELSERGQEFLCVSAGSISRIVTLATGGSTGIPKRIYFTEEDQQLTVDFFENGMKLIVDKSDNVLILMPARMPGSIGKLLGQGLRNLGAGVIEYGLPEPDELPELIEIIDDRNVTSVVALPTHMRTLAELELQKKRRKRRRQSRSRLRSVLLSAEYISYEDVRLIEDAFSCKVYEHYGMTEMGLGCAVGCGFGEGYHIRESDLYLEIIDPETGKNVEAGKTGEIVFTTLTRKGMPFIRYRTGDFSRFITEKCTCGSVLRRLDKVAPRDEIKGYLRNVSR